MMLDFVVRSIFLVISIAASAASAATIEVANGYTCVSATNPGKVIRGLIAQRAIPAQPYNGDDGIKAFAVRSGFTAFGFPLIAVVGWDQSFGRLPVGTAPPTHLSYVVRANVWQLASAVRKAGAKLNSKNESSRSPPRIHVGGFNSEGPDPLPPGAGTQFAYARVTCEPRL